MAAQFGCSKEKRSNCPLVTLGWVMDGCMESGFPLSSQAFPGNASEPVTFSRMLAGLRHNNPLPAIPLRIVMNAALASNDNIILAD